MTQEFKGGGGYSLKWRGGSRIAKTSKGRGDNRGGSGRSRLLTKARGGDLDQGEKH